MTNHLETCPSIVRKNISCTVRHEPGITCSFSACTCPPERGPSLKDMLDTFFFKETPPFEYVSVELGERNREYLRERDARLAQLLMSFVQAEVARHKIEIHDPAQPNEVALRNGKKLGFYCSLGSQNVYNHLVDDLLVSLFDFQK